jgi:hypothetical protein
MNLKPLNLNTDIKLKLSESIPDQLLKTRKSGSTELTYITQNTCIDRLNDIFGYAWSFEILDHWMEPGVTQIKMENPKYPFTSKNTDMDAVKVNPEGKRYIELPQLPSAWVLVKLTVPMLTDSGEIIYISKMATGSQSITGPQSTQSINGYKGAQSDALKKAASLFGIALELYRDDVEQAEFEAFKETLTPDTWTEEIIEANRQEYDYLMNIMNDYGWSSADVSYYVEIATDGLCSNFNKMDPSYLKALIKAIEEEE